MPETLTQPHGRRGLEPPPARPRAGRGGDVRASLYYTGRKGSVFSCARSRPLASKSYLFGKVNLKVLFKIRYAVVVAVASAAV